MAEQKYSINGIVFTQKQVDAMIKTGVLNEKALASRVKNDPASLSLTGTQTAHGPSAGGTSTTQAGLFSDGRVRPQRFSALPRPRSFIGELDVIASEIFNEMTEILTGQLANNGVDADGYCGNPPSAGDLKVVAQNRIFGDFFMKTNLNSIPYVGQRLNYSDVPGEILNAAPEEFPLLPDILWKLTDTRDQFAFEMYKLGNAFQRSTVIQAWQGVAGQNGTQGDGWFKEFAGFDSLVKTGYTDVITGVAAPAADSVVVNWGGGDIGGNTSDGRDIVEVIGDVYYALSDRASQVGMGDTQWIIVMRKEQFRRLVEVYACSYATYRCQTGRAAGDPVVTDGMQVQALRTEMSKGQYLLIDGVPVPVLFDEGIALTRFTANPQVLQSDMFFMPLSWAGRPLTYLQHFKLDNPYAVQFANFTVRDRVKFLNNGLFAIAERDTGFCIEYHLASRLRPILETPFLAGRIDDISFTYSAATRGANPTPTWNYANGGKTYSALNNGL